MLASGIIGVARAAIASSAMHDAAVIGIDPAACPMNTWSMGALALIASPELDFGVSDKPQLRKLSLANVLQIRFFFERSRARAIPCFSIVPFPRAARGQLLARFEISPTRRLMGQRCDRVCRPVLDASL